MSDHETTEHKRHEQEPVRATFGDVIRLDGWPEEYSALVIEKERDGMFNVVTITNNPERPYGLPSTVHADRATEIYGHSPFDEIIEIVAYLACGMQKPTDESRMAVCKLLQPEIE